MEGHERAGKIKKGVDKVNEIISRVEVEGRGISRARPS